MLNNSLLSFDLYKIKRGKHYSTFKLPKIHFGIESWSKIVIFSESCYYEQQDIEDDLNKLWGYSYGHHHKHSIRIAWKPNRQNKSQIDLYLYMYYHGVRYYERICTIYIGKPYLIEMHNRIYSKRLIVPRVSVSLCMENSFWKTHDILRLIAEKDIPYPYEKKIGYELRPYFGGQPTAPHDMGIYLY